MTYEDLQRLGEERENALAHLKEVTEENKTSLLAAAQQRATDAVIAYEALTRPAILLPYIYRLLIDASRYRHFREEATALDWSTCSFLRGADLDKAIDAIIEASPDDSEEPDA